MNLQLRFYKKEFVKMKYDFKLDLENRTSHKMIIDQIEPNSTVLEFGPSTGYMTQYLKETLHCTVYIVELGKEEYDLAIRFAEDGICDDIMNFAWVEKFKNIEFDFILFADVLEHLYNPQKVLKKSSELLKGDGRVLISLPNIAHSSILINLFYNKFQYSETGLLDNSHIRFFAYENLDRLAEENGFKITAKDATYEESLSCEQAVNYDNRFVEILELMENRPYANVYQFILTLSKIDYVKQNNILPKNNLKYKTIQSRLFKDTGNGYNGEECIVECADYIECTETYKVKFDIKGRVESLRFDPIEGYACKIKIGTINSDGESLSFIPLNSHKKDNNWNEFFNVDPIYEIQGEIKNITYLEINFQLQYNNIMDVLQQLGEIDRKNSVKLADYSRVENLLKETHAKYEIIQTSLEHSLSELEETQVSLDNANTAKDLLQDHLCAIENKLFIMENSQCWRITKPVRTVLDYFKALAYNDFMNKCINKALPKGSNRRNLIKSLVRYIFKNKNVDTKKTPESDLTFDIMNYESIVILTTKHCNYIAMMLKNCLEKAGVKSHIIENIPPNGYRRVPHFVICPQMFDFLPDIYVAFQMEQTISNRWFTSDYIQKLHAAKAVFDYSLINIDILQKKGIGFNSIYYMPISFYNFSQNLTPTINKEYDVLFYGDDKCKRRNQYLRRVSKEFNVKIINDLFGDDLLTELKKAKIIINIHYYENSLLETTRLYEVLSLNTAVIISENSEDIEEHKELIEYVDFVENGDIDQFIERIRFWLNNEEAIENKLNFNKNIFNEKNKNQFEFYFYRYLLATNNISFEKFYSLASKNIQFSSDKWCLGLPETTDRRVVFMNRNQYDFEYFPGLRNERGWIGCGLSYKFLLRKAKEMKLNYVTICEDDVVFKPQFKDEFAHICDHLTNVEKWDVFSGLIADLSAKTQILNINKFEGEELIEIDRIVSMVFNIYNNTFFDFLEGWDHTNLNADVNTIDRYIENNVNVCALTSIPFLVGHEETLNSTLWNFSNEEYTDMIERSEELLFEKIKHWKDKRFC